ncbi:DUF6493 family protein [Undibacterium sp. JH2W]|uniref:DUF6493 family protein n=1 Tax=Undibacterium sp. JH2W TaxID=3413037 RepID=UPI003BF2A0C3
MSETNTIKLFAAKTPIEQFIVDADHQGLTDYLAGQSEEQRATLWPLIMHVEDLILYSNNKNIIGLRWDGPATEMQKRCLHIAIAWCGGINSIASRWTGFRPWADDLCDLFQTLPRNKAEELCDILLQRGPWSFRIIQSFFIKGFIERPTHENYLLGLMAEKVYGDDAPDMAYWIKHDPGLLQGPFLKLFDTGNINNAPAYNGKDWQRLFLELAQQGLYSRELLLDKTLTALETDRLLSRTGWCHQFHEALAPSTTEMASFTERYMGFLHHSRVPPNINMALTALSVLQTASMLDDAALLAALHPLLSSTIKAQVDAALKLIDQILKKESSLMHEAAAIVVFGLLHETADIQKKIIARLEKWGMDAATQEQARQLLPQVANSNRDALSALLGAASQEIAGQTTNRLGTPAKLPQLQALPSPIAGSRALVKIQSLEDLVEACTYAFENHNDTDCFETIFDALLRFSPYSAEGKKQFGPVLKRAKKLKPVEGNWHHMDRPLARELARLLTYIFEGERLPATKSFACSHFNVHSAICQRTDDLMDILAQGKSVAPLAAPTHQRGYIDPTILIERSREQYALGMQQPLQEQVLSLLRLAASNDVDLRQQAASLPDSPYHLALRYALGAQVTIPTMGEDSALFIAAARARYPNKDDPKLIQLYGDVGPDGSHAASTRFGMHDRKNGEYTFYHCLPHTTPIPKPADPTYLSTLRYSQLVERNGHYWPAYYFSSDNENQIHWSASMLPSSVEAVLTEGVCLISGNLDWADAYWHHQAYLKLLLDRTVAMSSSAIILLAFALAGKEPGQTAIAIDVLVASWLEGRLDAAALGHAIHDLLATPIVMASRYAKSLGKAARAHTLTPHLVFQLLCIMVTQSPQTPPKDMAMLLELLHELRLELQLDLPEATLHALQNMQIGGKGKTAVKALLAG